MHKTPFGQAKKEGEEKRGEFERNLFIKEGPTYSSETDCGKWRVLDDIFNLFDEFRGRRRPPPQFGKFGFCIFFLLLL